MNSTAASFPDQITSTTRSVEKTTRKRSHKKHKHKQKPTRRPHHKRRYNATKTFSAPTSTLMMISNLSSNFIGHGQKQRTVTQVTQIVPVTNTTVDKTFKAVESREETYVQSKKHNTIVVIELTNKGYKSGSKPATEYQQHSGSSGSTNCVSPIVVRGMALLITIIYYVHVTMEGYTNN